jgi:hypothetical protein
MTDAPRRRRFLVHDDQNRLEHRGITSGQQADSMARWRADCKTGWRATAMTSARA